MNMTGNTSEVMEPVENKERIPQMADDDIKTAVENSHSTVRDSSHYADNEFLLSVKAQNPLVQLSNSILSLPPTLRAMESVEDIGNLYENIKNEIYAIFEELNNKGYDEAVRLSFRYCLCAFIDEAVMSTSWGSKSKWAERSMLSFFHNETYAGEKFYQIMHRLLREPETYRELLEFIYLCLALGYEGRYHLDDTGAEQINEYIKQIYAKLYASDDSGVRLTLPKPEHKKKPFRLKVFSPIGYIWIVLVISVVTYYWVSRYQWNREIQSIMELLAQIKF